MLPPSLSLLISLCAYLSLQIPLSFFFASLSALPLFVSLNLPILLFHTDVKDLCCRGTTMFALHEGKRVVSKLALLGGPEAVAALMSLHSSEPPSSPRAPILLRDAVMVLRTRVAKMSAGEVCGILPQGLLQNLVELVRATPAVSKEGGK